MKRTVTVELIWIVCIALVALFITFLLGGFSSSVIDIQLHDTYYVIYVHQFVLWIFLIVAFVTYMVRVVGKKFRNKATNAVLLLITTGLAVMMIQFYLLITTLTEF